MHRLKNSRQFLSTSEIVTHAMLMVAAVAIAFSLPAGVHLFIDRWWPAISTNPDWLFLTEAGLAGALVAVFVTIKNALQNRYFVDSAKRAALVHARTRGDWLARWRERMLLNKLSAEHVGVLTVTGYDTFARPDSQFHAVLENAREVRALLLNPLSDGARMRADSLSAERDYYGRMLEEIHESIAYLQSLRRAGKKVVLKFYDQRPFWKLVIVGEYAWVQYCREGCEVRAMPEYVFASHAGGPEQGLFTPFSMLFAEKWGEAPALDFDFDSGELVRYDADGTELGRALLPRSPHAGKKLAIARHAQCALTGYIPNQA